MNFVEFDKIIYRLFDCVAEEAQDDWTFDDWFEMASQVVDNSEFVIYYCKAWEMVYSMRMRDYDRFLEAEQAVEDLGIERSSTDDWITALAFQILFQAVMAEVEEQINPVEA